MRDSDAFSWYMERDPILRATVVAVTWLERSPDWEAFVARLDRATRLIPMFRQRVLESPARLSTPRWAVDDGFDLTWHLRRMDSPAPHTPDTVLAVARVAAMTGFDRSRPLWEFTLVEHLEGDRAALVMKLHHSLTDGLGGVQMALLLFDVDQTSPGPALEPDEPHGEHFGTGELVRQGLAQDWRRLAGLVGRGVGSAVPRALRTARHPVSTVTDVVGFFSFLGIATVWFGLK